MIGMEDSKYSIYDCKDLKKEIFTGKIFMVNSCLLEKNSSIILIYVSCNRNYEKFTKLVISKISNGY